MADKGVCTGSLHWETTVPGVRNPCQMKEVSSMKKFDDRMPQISHITVVLRR